MRFLSKLTVSFAWLPLAASASIAGEPVNIVETQGVLRDDSPCRTRALPHAPWQPGMKCNFEVFMKEPKKLGHFYMGKDTLLIAAPGTYETTKGTVFKVTANGVIVSCKSAGGI